MTTLKNSQNADQQHQVLTLLKANPALMSSFIKQSQQGQQLQQQQQQQQQIVHQPQVS